MSSRRAGQRKGKKRTVDGEISEGRTGRPLDLGVVATEEEEDRVESVSADGPDLLLSYLCKSESGAPLEVYVV
jgi:hypothetical protein